MCRNPAPLSSYLYLWLGRERLSKATQEKGSSIRGRTFRENLSTKVGRMHTSDLSTKKSSVQRLFWAGRCRHKGHYGKAREGATTFFFFFKGRNSSAREGKACSFQLSILCGQSLYPICASVGNRKQFILI